MTEFEWWTEVWLPLIGIVVPGIVGLSGLVVAVVAQRQTKAVTDREAARTATEAEERRAEREADRAERLAREERELREALVRDVMKWAASEFAAEPEHVRPRAELIAELTTLQSRLLASGLEGSEVLQDILWGVDVVAPTARRSATSRRVIAGRAMSMVRRAVAGWVREPEKLPEIRDMVGGHWFQRLLHAADAAEEGDDEAVTLV